MQYLLLIYDSEAVLGKMSPADQSKMYGGLRQVHE